VSHRVAQFGAHVMLMGFVLGDESWVIF
jgi:hypothetical protein